MGALHFAITADNRQFARVVRDTQRSVEAASNKIKQSGLEIDEFFRRMKNNILGIAGAFSAKQFISEIAKVRGEFQQFEIAFETMLGSGEKASALMNQLIHTAAITPFGMTDVTNGAKQLLAYGIAADEVNDTLIRLGDIAAGLSLPLNDLVMLYGTTMTQGRMFTQDIRQFQSRGIPIVDELAKQFGVAKDKVGELVTAGKVGVQEFQQAIISMTLEGSKFGGLMEKQSKTITGQISNIEDAVEQMFNQIGKQNEGLISDTLGVVSTLVENWETVGKVLLTIVSAYGSYKAAVIAVGVAHKMAAIWGEVQAFLSLTKSITSAKDAMLLLNMATSANPIGLLLGVVGATAASFALFSKNADKASTMTEKFGTNAASAISKLDTLDKIIKGSSQNSELHRKAMTELNNVLEEFGLEALQEGASIDEVNSKRAQAIALIKEEAVERQRANALEQGQQDYTNTLKSAREQLLSDLSNATTGKKILGIDFSAANDEIRENASAISSIVGDLVERNITEIAGKTGKDYEQGLTKIYSEIQERMKAIGLSDETIQSSWKDGGIIWVENILGKYIDKVKEAEEQHDRFTDSIEKWSKAETEAADNAMTFEDKVQAVSKRLIGAGDDVHGLYKRVKELMSQYSDNTIGFTIQFNGKVPEWMNSKEIPELQQLATRFAALGNKATDAGVKIGDKLWSKQELLQRSAEYAQAAENKQSEIDRKKKEEASKTEAERKREAKEAQRQAENARKQAVAIEAAGAKLADVIRKQEEERLRLEQDFEYERWQTRVDLMEEGQKKVLAQQELNFSKEKSDLKRRLDDELEAELNRQIVLFDARENLTAAKNKTYGKRAFRDSDIDESKMDEIRNSFKAFEADLNETQKLLQNERLKEAKESMNEYLKEYGSYQQKREAIQAEYEKKIDNSSNVGERLMNEAKLSKELSELDFNEWLNSGEIAAAFGDLTNLSKETISKLIEDLEKYREQVIATFDPNKVQQYEDALSNLRQAEFKDAFNAFGSMVPEYFSKRLEIQKQINDEAKIGLELANKVNDLALRTDSQKGMVKIYAKSAGYDLSDDDVKDTSKMQQLADHVATSATNGNQFAINLHKALVELLKLNEEATNLEVASKEWDGNFAHLKETLQNLEGEEKFKAICESVNSAADLVGDLAGQAQSLAEALGANGLGAAFGYLGDAMGSVSNIASGFAQGGIVGGIAAAAGEVMGWTTKLFMAGDQKHQRNIERIQERIDALNKSYEKLGKSAEDAYSTDASKMIDQQNTLLKQQSVLVKQQMAEEEAKKKTDSDKIKEYKERLEEIDEALADNAKKVKEAIIGEDLKSAIAEFSSLYAEAWDNGTEAAQTSMKAVKKIISSALTELLKKDIQPATQKFYDELAEAMEKGFLTDEDLARLDNLKAQIDILAAKSEEQYKMIQERYKDLDELRENLTDISFSSVRDNFKSLLADMESSTEDFADSFTDMLRNALIEGLMNDKYNLMLKQWYDEFAQAMDDKTLTEVERDSLKQQYNSIVQQAIDDRNAFNDILGGTSYSQSATSGGWSTMGQDTADELSGRFTALTELNAINNNLVAEGNMIGSQILDTLKSLSSLSMVTDRDNSTLREIRDMMFLSTNHLENIEKYSKRLNAIEDYMRSMDNTLKTRL